MRAAVCEQYGSVSDLLIKELPSPQPGAGEICIRVHAASVNFPDVLIVQGRYQFKPKPPFSPGNEVAGVVTAVGEGVEDFALGDRVAAAMLWGAFAEEVVVSVEQAFLLPDAVDFEVGATLITAYATTIYALVERAGIQAGERLAVLGAAGGVGLAAVQLGRLLGAEVTACASSDDKLTICQEQGAQHLINYSNSELKPALKAVAPAGFDVIYDPVGGAHSEAALRALAPNGRLLVIGFASGEIPRIPLNLVLLKSCQIVGVFWGMYFKSQPEAHRLLFQRVLDWVATGALKPHIDGRYPLAKVVEALQCLEQRRVRGKVIITMDN